MILLTKQNLILLKLKNFFKIKIKIRTKTLLKNVFFQIIIHMYSKQ